VKGYGMGESGEGTNTTHSQKKMAVESLRKMRDRFNIDLSDEQVENLEYIKPDPDHPAIKYMQGQRKKLGGYLPQRNKFAAPLEVPALDAFKALLGASGDREMSTTMAFVRILTTLTKDKKLGKNVVPIVPDEARTFGMEGMFRQLGIYSSVGQLYEPQDRDQIMYYKEDKSGQILEEGINEAGAMSSWIAAATAYSTHGVNMVPFYIYYSMFGFQRIGDLAWLAGDMSARGFLIGGTAGRTTLNGEGLQHEDGHSHIQANTIPNCISYDPCYAYELAVIVQHGMKRMYADQENIFYYITTMNENYSHPAMPVGAEEGIIRGMYKLKERGEGELRVSLLGSGTILREVEKAAGMLKEDWGVDSDVWSVTSFNELARDGQAAERWNMLNSDKPQKSAYITDMLQDCDCPVVAASDYMKNHAEQVRAWIPRSYKVLGTDGFGRSDTRDALRDFFEVDARYVVVAALRALADDGKLELAKVAQAVAKYELDPNKPNPISV
ncbi:MAG: transketolase-like TK C-terminal-containing protein, partial [Granulosicoccaceae bacterium]